MFNPLMNRWFFVFLFITISFRVPAQQAPQLLPHFSFSTLDGKVFTEKSVEPARTLFFCFFDVSCLHCRRAISSLDRQLAVFSKADVYLVSVEPAASVRNFLGHYGPRLLTSEHVRVLQDARGEFQQHFHPANYPAMYLYSPQKKLLLFGDTEESVGEFVKKLQPMTQ